MHQPKAGTHLVSYNHFSTKIKMYLCPPLRLLITSGMMQCDMDPYDWLNKFQSLYMAVIVGIVSRHGLNDMCHTNNQRVS